jgi:hypothetical protein
LLVDPPKLDWVVNDIVGSATRMTSRIFDPSIDPPLLRQKSNFEFKRNSGAQWGVS